MAKPKRKLTAAEKAAKARRKAEFMFIFLNGRQKMVRRSGLDDDEFIRNNADPLWLHQNEMWEYIAQAEAREAAAPTNANHDDDCIPF